GGADAAAAQTDVSDTSHRAARRDLAAPRAPSPPRPPRTDRAQLARAALAQAGLLLAPQPRSRGPALLRLLPLHLAHPPLSRPRLPPRAAVSDRRARARAAGGRAWRAGDVDIRTGARGGAARARRRRRRPLPRARARALRRPP